jgi:hypothetical protein
MKSTTFSFRQRLKEIDMFFQRRDPVHQTMNRLVKRLEKANIPYAIVGGMAVNAHRYRRTTGDVDVLLTPAGLAEFRRLFVEKYYKAFPQRKRRFVDQTNDVYIDILETGLFPGTGKPGPISYPDPAQVGETIDNIQVVNLETLITLKLAARRHKDFADVVDLIRYNNLDESFLDRLPPSVRSDFIECLEEKWREDDYIAREG